MGGEGIMLIHFFEKECVVTRDGLFTSVEDVTVTDSLILCFIHTGSRISSWALNWVSFTPNGTKLGIFKISFRKFCSMSHNVPKMMLKSPRFVPFEVKLTQYGA